ncbi:Glycosyltransferase involved in cell wall bisynthesis [Chishuiella changwenlii]|uniref:Glycosyl transferase n=1 Tax=Chishuiella changwenlii TaxID=1434701 RepID=A0A1M7A5S9_9FLAO|nr:glycosyltransferase [Chishuiella changwenlii]GGF10239.1 glycosyl transferase [Chishuiella changwenlii]SHL38072.1 Glycosyltransferase involved in cell wall bisynthesis [Chishuiella changwenlii]
MNILQVSTGFDISHNGGITNYVRNISSTLVDFGHKVTVLYSQDNNQEKDYNFNLINIHPILKPFHLNSVISNTDIEKVEKIIKKLNPDIIHVHMMIDLPAGILEIFKKYSKVVISLHDYSYICNRIILMDREGNNCINNNQNRKCESCIPFEETIDNRIIAGVLRKTAKILGVNKLSNSSYHHERLKYSQKLFSEINGITAVSNRVKEIYLSNGFTNDNFFVNHIGNYTAEEEFRSSFGRKDNIEIEQKIKFGFIGFLDFYKGSEIFIEFAKNSYHDFHIYGNISDSVLNRIKNEPNIFYHGKYNHEDLKNILMNIDIGLVLPVWEDNAPQVVFEFLNSGIPIIGTRMGGLPDFINDQNGRLFENTPNEIDNMKSFIDSDEIYNFYNERINKIKGTKKAAEHMTELLNIYNSI